jgi:hypothetical protein
MISLLEKLEVNSISGLIEIMNKNNYAQDILYKAYSKYSNHYFKEALDVLSQVNYAKLKTQSTKKLYNYIDIVTKIELKIMPESTGMEKLKQLINYPDILENDILSFVEVNVLLFISNYLLRTDNDFRIPNLMFEILKKNSISPNQALSKNLPIYHSQVARSLGIIGEIEKSLEIANRGIEFCNKHKLLSGLEHLLYFKALSEKELYDDERYIHTTRRLFNAIAIFEETELTLKFYTVIKKNLGFTKDDFHK